MVRIPALKSAAAFRERVAALGLDLPCDDAILSGSASPLAWPVEQARINGKRIGNRCAIHPMEGWDGTLSGGVTEDVRRRWRRFGESGAKLIFGGEAMAVRPDGRANPNQLIIDEANKAGLADLVETLVRSHRERHGKTDDLVVGFQLTHSGRFCKPNSQTRFEPRVAYRHPILDRKFGVTSDAAVLTDGEVERLIMDYVRAARIAWDVGADFVDLKHCHGYLLHEFLSAFTRPGKYGGSFDNRTRILREIVAGIRRSGNPIDLAVRLSAFDFVPFRPAVTATRAEAVGPPGRFNSSSLPGIPEDYAGWLPYRYAFGVDVDNPMEIDLTEPRQFLDLCAALGVKLVNVSAGSPYYNPHIQRPAAYPPSDGYGPPEDPLIGVARQIQAVRQLKQTAPKELVLIGTGYTYLQEYLAQVAQCVLRDGWTDMVGIGRMVLSYPAFFADVLGTGRVSSKAICRTFSDCTSAPRNGLASGCYPLDDYYSSRPAAEALKAINSKARAEPEY